MLHLCYINLQVCIAYSKQICCCGICFYSLNFIYFSLLCHMHWRIQGAPPARAPPTGSISFIFTYVFTEKCTRRRSAPPNGKSSIRHWYGFVIDSLLCKIFSKWMCNGPNLFQLNWNNGTTIKKSFVLEISTIRRCGFAVDPLLKCLPSLDTCCCMYNTEVFKKRIMWVQTSGIKRNYNHKSLEISTFRRRGFVVDPLLLCNIHAPNSNIWKTI